MREFFIEGGFPMYPVLLFGFLMNTAGVLYAMRGEARFRDALVALGAATYSSGVLGAATGVMTSIRYIGKVAPPERSYVLALGCEESLHNIVLAGVLVTIGCLIATVGAARARARA